MLGRSPSLLFPVVSLSVCDRLGRADKHALQVMKKTKHIIITNSYRDSDFMKKTKRIDLLRDMN